MPEIEMRNFGVFIILGNGEVYTTETIYHLAKVCSTPEMKYHL